MLGIECGTESAIELGGNFKMKMERWRESVYTCTLYGYRNPNKVEPKLAIYFPFELFPTILVDLLKISSREYEIGGAR